MNEQIKTKDAEAHARAAAGEVPTHTRGVGQLAEIFGIRSQSVSEWGEYLPPLRALQLQSLRPSWFHRGRLRKAPK